MGQFIQHLATAILLLFLCGFIFLLGALAGTSMTFERYVNDVSNLLQTLDAIGTPLDHSVTVHALKPDAVHDGFFLIGGFYQNGPAVILVDAQGKVRHQWEIEKSMVNEAVFDAHPPLNKAIEDMIYGINDMLLLPDGDLIFSQSNYEFNNYRAQRLARIGKDGELRWEIPGFFHHDMILAEDGLIYSAGSALNDALPDLADTAPEAVFLEGIIHVANPQGQLKQKISVEEAFVNSAYKPYLTNFQFDLESIQTLKLDGTTLYDPIHLNSVDYITAEQAAQLEGIERGDLLISLRGNSTIAILRPSTQNIVWAARGPWRHQHYVRMDASATIFIYDNEGGSYLKADDRDVSLDIQPRILRYDMRTGKSDVILSNQSEVDLSSFWRGYYHTLDDGGFVMSAPDKGKLVQFTNENELVWLLRLVEDEDFNSTIPFTKKIASVKFYEKDDVEFLNH